MCTVLIIISLFSGEVLLGYLRARTQNIFKPQISFQRTETFNLSWNVSGDGKCFGIYIQYNYVLQTNYMSLNFLSLSNYWNFNNSVNSRTCNIHLIQLYDIIQILTMCCFFAFDHTKLNKGTLHLMVLVYKFMWNVTSLSNRHLVNFAEWWS